MEETAFRGRVALVTGGARGIGRACCLRLAQEGARVAVNYHNHEAAAREVVDEIARGGGEALAVQADISNPGDVATLVERVERELGPIELLVNSAGVLYREDDLHGSHEIWQQTLNVNLTGTYLVCWHVKDGMATRGFGRIVNLASIAGLRPRPGVIAYSVSKAGVIALTRSLAAAIADKGIRVNAVAPGLIETDMIRGMAAEHRQQLIEATPISRLGETAEIANLVRFLLSDQSSFMTGQTLVASGGRVMLP